MNCGVKVYRTDENGEVNITVDGNGKFCIELTTLVNNKSEGL